MSDVLFDLARVKAIFQCRAICAAMGIMEGNGLSCYKSDSEAAPSTNTESRNEAGYYGRIGE